MDRLRIFTLSGQLVSDEKSAGNVIEKSIPKQGIYLIEATSGSKRNVSKIVVNE
ncbi:MAG: T9SS type A sorting domain-containing protein [Tannerellaceae bacterium]|nr:T9SS type A sorting domain-containing protein [Tannerellaceae bacterium]